MEGGHLYGMTVPDRTLPDYKAPPISEVAIGVQVEPIERLVAPFLGLFWREIRTQYPDVDVQPPLQPQVEVFGESTESERPSVSVLDKLPTPRCWFVSKDETELVQLQGDRLIHNWRKRRDGDIYPRYQKLRDAFARELALLEAFIEDEKLGQFTPNQCEVSYINHILCDSLEEQGQLDRIFSLWKLPVGGFLPPAEGAQFAARFLMKDESGGPLGRVHVLAQPALRRTDRKPMVSLTLVARGRPEGAGRDGVLRFLDLGREWIVRTFDEITTPAMHRTWGRV